ncbi:AAA ATPase midasin [Mycoemilia scoparia]|uniref:Midasin n=1 Tax=Mycoemilia scoparia TaxID=417184 RepID=A0A9W7ZX92_9FUNG|nr:AAA ATPase midasin [Mycoemilia scoparia]
MSHEEDLQNNNNNNNNNITKENDKAVTENEETSLNNLPPTLDPFSVNLPEAIKTLIKEIENPQVSSDIALPKQAKRLIKSLKEWLKNPNREQADKVLNWLSALLLIDGFYNNKISKSHILGDQQPPNWIQIEANKSICTKILEIFRPLIIDLVARWVVPEAPIQVFSYLSDNTTSTADSEDDDDQQYIWSKCVAYATGLIISTTPQIKRLVMAFFTKSPAPFSIPTTNNKKKKMMKSNQHIQELLTLYRLLNAIPELLDSTSSKWNWYDYLYAGFNDSDPMVRYLSCECYSLVYGLSEGGKQELLANKFSQDSITTSLDLAKIRVQVLVGEQMRISQMNENMLKKAQEFSGSGKIWIAFTNNNNNNNDNSDDEDDDSNSDGNVIEKVPWVSENNLSDCTVNVSGMLLPRLISNNNHHTTTPTTTANVDNNKLVHTQTTAQNLQKMALASSLSSPILLTGLTGSGKTALIEELARLTGNELITIHLGDQTDSKVLLGTYTTTSQPGNFEWLPGVLASAVKLGKWVVFEDIDLASGEVISVILPLLESGELFIPSRGERIKAHSQFLLFATRSLLPSNRGRGGKAQPRRGVSATTDSMLSSSFWSKIDIEPLKRNELCDVIRGRFESLGPVASTLVDVFMKVSDPSSNSSSSSSTASIVETGDNDGQEMVVENTSTMTSGGGGGGGGGIGRFMSARDLLKWCHRVDHLIRQSSGNGNSSSGSSLAIQTRGSDFYLNEEGRQWLFQEASDVFCGMEPSYPAWLSMLKIIGTALGIPTERVDHFVEREVPNFDRSETRVKIGRCTLLRRSAAKSSQQATAGAERPFAETRHARKLMERIAVSAKLNEPVILVGETGTGKTTVVQRLADLLHQKLVIVNLSQQSDSSDLLGGFKPVDAKTLVVPLKEEFDGLFEKTFSLRSNAAYVESVRTAYGARNWKRLIKLFREACLRAYKLIDKANAAAMKIESTKDSQGSSDVVTKEKGSDKKSPKKERDDTTAADDSSGKPKRQKKSSGKSSRQLKINPEILEFMWKQFERDVISFEAQMEQTDKHLVFSFIEGTLVKAIKQGDWILLDEVNLASPETLESLSGLLQGASRSILLAERGDSKPIPRHPNFRIFACMNPATDVGKRDLPPGLRNRFTEYYVHPPDSNQDDLLALINCYLDRFVRTTPFMSNRVADFYREAKRLSGDHLIVDGAQQRPHYSLRTLSRALTFARDQAPVYSIRRALYDGLYMTFVTQLENESQKKLVAKLQSILFKDDKNINVNQVLSLAPAQPPNPSNSGNSHNNPNPPFIKYGGFWLQTGPIPINSDETKHYILTPSVEYNLHGLARAVMCGLYPVLIQGPTSAGKTSMIEFLAKQTGHKFVRINNHEHTDLQEYLGSYVSQSDGKLVFQEGVLVNALRNGHWLVLDELNLAPTDVLEALNRLLDDNRELFIPETQEVVRPHKHFRLFATQNPAGLYGGRKALSRAFRNRFVELHFGDLPQNELETILTARCEIAPSYAKKLVMVYKKLTEQRQQSRVFEARHGYITLRDMFRWASRGAIGYQELAEHGYMILAERVRNVDEKEVVKKALEDVMRVKIDEADMYSFERLNQLPEYKGYLALKDFANGSGGEQQLPRLAWTHAMRRLFTLVSLCLRHHEPVLLVGETGCGKTTVCQVLSAVRKQCLHMVNCHQNTETSDLLGGQRPLRDRSRIMHEAQQRLIDVLVELGKRLPVVAQIVNEAITQNSGDGDEGASIEELPFDNLKAIWARMVDKKGPTFSSIQELLNNPLDSHQELTSKVNAMVDLLSRSNMLFEWCDGPLVQAMKNGDLFLLDEISLADDSVLERLNSVLEPSKFLMLAEKAGESGGLEVEPILGADGFEFLATMNPGGDYGKRELSPALRNRFTELWVPAISGRSDLEQILSERLTEKLQSVSLPSDHSIPEKSSVSGCVNLVLDFVEWLVKTLVPSVSGGSGSSTKGDEVAALSIISLRDYLAWTDFIACTSHIFGMGQAMAHGGCLVLLDGIGSHAALGGAFSSQNIKQQIKNKCVSKLISMTKSLPGNHNNGDGGIQHSLVGLVDASELIKQNNIQSLGSLIEKKQQSQDGQKTLIGVNPFWVPIGSLKPKRDDFAFQAPTTFDNFVRVLRGLQITKPILLEGSPGVGKTSLISALAKLTGNNLVRINLSDQTDLMDLFGSDLPVEGGAPGEFAWRDAPFLQAMQNGDWVLLDEINLASQSVLEGLNACLDHRGTVYVSELDKYFSRAPDFRLFAAQNPIHQGGGRKGLPKSFINRFTQVYVNALDRDDLLLICTHLYGHAFSNEVIQNVLDFNYAMHERTMSSRQFGRDGSPWEFNLRDVARWLEIASASKRTDGSFPARAVNDGDVTTTKPSRPLLAPIGYFARLMYVDRMRTRQDRDQVVHLYKEIFGEKDIHQLTETPRFSLTKSALQAGHAVMPRQSVSNGPTNSTVNIDILKSQLGPLESVMHCLSMSWMPILVGQSGVGKTTLVRWLAKATGNRLVEFSMNSGVDTLELLGGFEQVDLIRHISRILDLSFQVLQSLEYKITIENSGVAVTKSDSLVSLQKLFSLINSEKSKAPTGELFSLMDDLLSQLRSLSGSIHHSISDEFSNDHDNNSATTGVIHKLENIASQLEMVKDVARKGVTGQFEWVDGALVEALEHGHWLLVDRANLCNPSVLDRLNGLLEPKGVLIMNERGMVNGKVKIIKPHPNFRIIMTVDPRAGELSRAMRNRGTEICMLPLQQQQQMNRQQGTGTNNCLLDWYLIAQSNGVNGLGVTKRLLESVKLEETSSKMAAAVVDERYFVMSCRFIAEKLQRGVPLPVVVVDNEDGKSKSFEEGIFSNMLLWLSRLPKINRLDSSDIISLLGQIGLAQFSESDLLLSSGTNDKSDQTTALQDLSQGLLNAIISLASYPGSSVEADKLRVQIEAVNELISSSNQMNDPQYQNLLEEFYALISDHPVTKCLGSCTQSLLCQAGLLSTGTEDIPLDLELCKPISQLLEIADNDDSLKNDVTWKFGRDLQKALFQLLLLLIQRNCFKKKSESKDILPTKGSHLETPKSMSHLRQAYLYYATEGQRMTSTQLSHSILASVYPMLESVNDLVDWWQSVLVGLAQDAHHYPQVTTDQVLLKVTSSIQALITYRGQIWNILKQSSGSNVNVSNMSANSEWIQKTIKYIHEALHSSGLLSLLESNGDSVVDAKPLDNAIYHVDNVCSQMDQTGLFVSRAIWKNSHPVTLSDPELRDLEQRLLDISKDLNTLDNEDGDEKKEWQNWITEGLATIYTLADQGKQERIQGHVANTYYSDRARLVKALSLLVDNMESKKDSTSNKKPHSPNEDYQDTQIQLSATPHSFVEHVSVLKIQSFITQLLSLITNLPDVGSDCQISNEELSVYGQICDNITKRVLTTLGSVKLDINIVRSSLKDQIITATRLLYNFQRLSWLLEGYQSRTFNATDSDRIWHFIRQVKAIITDLIAPLHNILWQPFPELTVDGSPIIETESATRSNAMAISYIPPSGSSSAIETATLTPLMWSLAIASKNVPLHGRLDLFTNNQELLIACVKKISSPSAVEYQGHQQMSCVQQGNTEDVPSFVLGVLNSCSEAMGHITHLLWIVSTIASVDNIKLKNTLHTATKTLSNMICIVSSRNGLRSDDGQLSNACKEWAISVEQALAILPSNSSSAILRAIREAFKSAFNLIRELFVDEGLCQAAAVTAWIKKKPRLNTASARVSINTSLMMIVALVPETPIDPAIRSQAQWNLFKDQLSELKSDKLAHELIERYRTGNDSSNDKIRRLDEQISYKVQEISKAEIEVVYRPSSQTSVLAKKIKSRNDGGRSFNVLWKEMRMLVDGPLAFTKVSELFELATATTATSASPIVRFISREQAIQRSLAQAIQRVEHHYYDGYRDIAQVWITWLQKFRQGLQKLGFAAQQTMVHNDPVSERVFRSVTEWLPRYPYSLGLFSLQDSTNNGDDDSWMKLTDLQTLVAIKHALTTSKSSAGTPTSMVTLYTRFLILLLKHVQQIAYTIGYLSPEIVIGIDNILSEMFNIWHWAEEQRKKKEAEESSLYKTRDYENEDMSDAAIAERELMELFPSYEDSFDDVADVDELNCSDKKTGANEGSQAKKKKGGVPGVINPDVLTELVKTHQDMISLLSSGPITSSQLSGQERRDSLKTLVRETQNVCSLIFSALDNTDIGGSGEDGQYLLPMDESTDKQLRISHAIATAINQLESFDNAQSAVDTSYKFAKSKRSINKVTKPYNFYKDPNASECDKLCGVVGPLKKRIAQLLSAWPDHPVLQQIQQLADRILSFSVDSPVARLLTGIEMLFQKSQEWQLYASKDVSIKDELDQISAQIVAWRQVELNTWPHLLKLQEVEAATNSHSWWFNLYSTLVLSEAGAQGHDSTSGGKAVLPSDVVSLIDQFLQMCPVGEFEERLNLISTLHLHRQAKNQLLPLNGESNSNGDGILYAIDNSVRHYSQFIPTLRKHLEMCRAPISKNLAEFVKISTWRDVNPAALKESAQKTHRNLTKYVRKWREILCQPINQIIESDITQYVSNAGESERVFSALTTPKKATKQSKRKSKRSKKPKKDSTGENLEDADDQTGSYPGTASSGLLDVEYKPIPESLKQIVSKGSTAQTVETLAKLDKNLEMLQRRCSKEPTLSNQISWEQYITDRDPASSETGLDKTYASPLMEFGKEIARTIHKFQTMQTPHEIANKAEILLNQQGSNSDENTDPAMKVKKGKRMIQLMANKKSKNDTEDGSTMITEEEAKEAQRQAIKNFWAHQKQVKHKVMVDMLREMKKLGLNPHFSRKANSYTNNKASAAAASSEEQKGKKEDQKSNTQDFVHLTKPAFELNQFNQTLETFCKPFVSVADAGKSQKQPLLKFDHDGLIMARDELLVSDKAFYEIHLLVQRLRASALSPSLIAPQDLTPTQISRIVNMMEHSVHLVSEERRVGVKAISQAGDWIRLVSAVWQSLSIENQHQENANTNNNTATWKSFKAFSDSKHLLDRIEETYNQMILAIELVDQAKGWQSSSTTDDQKLPLLETLRSTQKQLSGLKDRAANLFAKHVLSTRSLQNESFDISEIDFLLNYLPDLNQLYNDLVKGLNDARDSLTRLSAMYPQLLPWFGDLLPMVEFALSKSTNSNGKDSTKPLTTKKEQQGSSPGSNNGYVDELTEQIHRVCHALMVLLQAYFEECSQFRSQTSSSNSSKDNDGQDGSMSEGEIRNRSKHYSRLIQHLQLSKMTQHFHKLTKVISGAATSSISSGHNSSEILEYIKWILSCRAKPLIAQYTLIVQHTLIQYIQHHYRFSYCTSTLLRTFTSVLIKGIRSPAEQQALEEDGEGEEGDEGTGKFESGTGMGEDNTEGAKNVSDEIEDEEQVLGTKDEQQQQQDNNENQPSRNEDAIEMENDFAGELGEADLETDDDDISLPSDSEGEEDDMDEQIGDVDLDDPTAFDEKLWEDDGEDDDEDGKPESKQSEEKQVEQKASQGKKDQDLVANEDDEEGDNPEANQKDGKDSNEMDQEEQQQQPEQQDQNDFNASPPPMADVEDAGEQFELPDDLDFGDDDDNDEGGDNEKKESEDKDDGEDEEGGKQKDEDKDKMEVEDDDKDTKGDEDEMNIDDGQNEDPDNLDPESSKNAVEEEMEDGQPGQDELAPVDDDGNQDGDDEEDLEKDDDGVLESEQLQEQEGGDDDEQAGEDQGQEDNDDDKTKKAQADEKPTSKDTYGIEAEKGLKGSEDSQEESATVDDSDDKKDGAGEDSKEDMNQQQQESMSRSGQRMDNNQQSQQNAANQQQQQQGQQDPNNQETNQDESGSKPENANPIRSLADVVEKWQRRLQIFEREDNVDSDNKMVESDAEDDENDEKPSDLDGNQQREFEFAKDEEKHEAVGLADAKDEEMMQQQGDEWKDAEQQQQNSEEDNVDKMDVEDSMDTNNQDSSNNQNTSSNSQVPKTLDPRLMQSLQDISTENQSTENKGDSPDKEEAATIQRATLESEIKNELLTDSADLQEQDDHIDPHKLRPEEAHGPSLAELREELELLTAQWQEGDKDTQLAIKLWQHYQQATHDLSMMLTEQLRLVLAPTLATQLRGDYRTGKRLNMKKIIPYIASQFKKDKIWLRRTKPSRRQYQVMIAVDDSKSMASSTRTVELAYESLALITSSLNHLEVGQMAIMSFGENVKLLHPFDQPFDNTSGARVLQQFTFDQDRTNVDKLLSTSLDLFEEAKLEASSSQVNPDLWQLQLIISDGICEDHPKLRQMVRAAVEKRVMLVFIVIDQLNKQGDKKTETVTGATGAVGNNNKNSNSKNRSDSIMDIQKVSYDMGEDGQINLKIERYLDTFPFDYYAILRDIQGLPGVLGDTLRQYFALVGSD